MLFRGNTVTTATQTVTFRQQRIQSGASSPTSESESIPRASARTWCASSPPRKTSPRGCSTGGSRRIATWTDDVKSRAGGQNIRFPPVDYQHEHDLYAAQAEEEAARASMKSIRRFAQAPSRSSASRSTSRNASPGSPSMPCSTAFPSPTSVSAAKTCPDGRHLLLVLRGGATYLELRQEVSRLGGCRTTTTYLRHAQLGWSSATLVRVHSRRAVRCPTGSCPRVSRINAKEPVNSSRR